MSFTTDTSFVRERGVYHSEIRPGWDIMGNANGGYLMAIAARAMGDVSRPHPISVSAHFLSPGKPGPVSISPTIVKQGRNFSTVRASMVGPEKPIIELLGSFGELSSADNAVLVDAEPPDLPAPDECVARERPSSGAPPPFIDKLDIRLHPEDALFYENRPSGRPLMRGWIKMADDEPIDAFGLLLVADVFPPTIFNADLPRAWVPTLEMTSHVRGLPEPGWLRCQFSTRFVTGGFLEEDGEVWDASGKLVVQSRQLALMPRT
ncbi:MAG: thioesterase family protein [Halioglobus sp.]